MSGQPAEPLIARELTWYYGEVIGVEGLDLALRPGEVYGLVGLNGAGKSTTLRLLLGLLAPSRGQALLFGRPARHVVDDRRRLGYLPSELPLYRDRSGTENLDLLARLGGHPKRPLEAARYELAARLGLNAADLDRTAARMSHGMRQKIGILQALEHIPDLVVLDEPSDGLDPVARAELAALLDDVRARGGTVLLASHVLTELERVADRVGVLHRGQLVAEETAASLRTREAVRIEATFQGSPPDLTQLSGVTVIAANARKIVARAQPPLDCIVKTLATATVADLTIHEPSLDDLVAAIVSGAESS